MNYWDMFRSIRMRATTAGTQAELGVRDVVNGKGASMLRMRLSMIREELDAAERLARELDLELQRVLEDENSREAVAPCRAGKGEASRVGLGAAPKNLLDDREQYHGPERPKEVKL